jgi:hypothetical protein
MLLTIPGSIAVAILRYRLYDIDRIINRTIVYSVLTVVLGLVYVAGVVGLGGVVRRIAGGNSNSLVVAASTLTVAALFRPARARVQGLIDRRFYRRRYDAVRTVEGFTARLRDEVALDSLAVLAAEGLGGPDVEELSRVVPLVDGLYTSMPS